MTLYIVFGVPSLASRHMTDVEGRLEYSEFQLALQSALADNRKCNAVFEDAIIDAALTSAQVLDLKLPGIGSLTEGDRYGIINIDKIRTSSVELVSETATSQTVAVVFGVEASSSKGLVRPLKNLSFFKGLTLDKATGAVSGCVNDGVIGAGELCAGDECSGTPAVAGEDINLIQKTGYCRSADGQFEYFFRGGLYGEELDMGGAEVRVKIYHAKDTSVLACDTGWRGVGAGNMIGCGQVKAGLRYLTFPQASHIHPSSGVEINDCSLELRSGTAMPQAIFNHDPDGFNGRGSMGTFSGTSASADNCTWNQLIGSVSAYAPNQDRCIAFCMRQRVYDPGPSLPTGSCTYAGNVIQGAAFGGWQ